MTREPEFKLNKEKCITIKLLINGVSGSGKTSLLESLGEDTFVVSRDAKAFGLAIPHMLVDTYVDMQTFIHGNEKAEIEGIVQKLEKYEEHYGKFPTNVVIDSVSQVFMDTIDVAAQTPNVFGSQGAEVTKEMGMLVKFLHEDLELNGMNVILLNHVIEEVSEGNKTGNLLPFGSGKFLAKGAFFATTNESVTLVVEGANRSVYLRGVAKQARTTCKDLPDKMWTVNVNNPEKSKKLKDDESYFNLQKHIDYLTDKQQNVKKWSL